MQTVLEAIYQAVVEGNRQAVVEQVKAALTEGLEAQEILNQGLVAAMAEVGSLFEQGEYYVPEMLVAARAMQAGLAILKPELVAADIQPVGRVIAGTVRGDLHDIGKNLVCMMLEGAGFAIEDLGSDVTPEKFVEAVRAGPVDLVALSALLTTTMPNMKATIEALELAGVRRQVKVIIGGAPVTQAYADQIGADGYASDASRAVRLAQTLMNS